jgi:hypothetical protein
MRGQLSLHADEAPAERYRVEQKKVT